VSGSLSAGNLFGVDQVDPYHAGQPVASGIWIENDVANRFDHMFASNCASGLVSGTSLLSWRMESQFDALYVGSFRTGVKIGNNGADAALDRYAKGTASPTLKGSTTAGANTYTENTLRYTLVGNRVYFSIRISLTSKDGAMAGNISIAGLPIAAAAGGHIVGVAVPVFENTTLTAGYTVLGGWIAAGASEIILWQSGTGVSRLNLAAAAISSTTSLYLDGHYEI
jgi:hypothetical protein